MKPLIFSVQCPPPPPICSLGCLFEVGQVVLRPGLVRLSYTAAQVSSVQCNIDDDAFIDCEYLAIFENVCLTLL